MILVVTSSAGLESLSRFNHAPPSRPSMQLIGSSTAPARNSSIIHPPESGRDPLRRNPHPHAQINIRIQIQSMAHKHRPASTDAPDHGLWFSLSSQTRRGSCSLNASSRGALPSLSALSRFTRQPISRAISRSPSNPLTLAPPLLFLSLFLSPSLPTLYHRPSTPQSFFETVNFGHARRTHHQHTRLESTHSTHTRTHASAHLTSPDHAPDPMLPGSDVLDVASSEMFCMQWMGSPCRE